MRARYMACSSTFLSFRLSPCQSTVAQSALIKQLPTDREGILEVPLGMLGQVVRAPTFDDTERLLAADLTSSGEPVGLSPHTIDSVSQILMKILHRDDLTIEVNLAIVRQHGHEVKVSFLAHVPPTFSGEVLEIFQDFNYSTLIMHCQLVFVFT